MADDAFRALAGAVWDQMPKKWEQRIDNLVLLIEDEPDDAVRAREHLTEHETLLGLYHGIPESERGGAYGVGVTLPDTITLFRIPILEEAAELMHTRAIAEPRAAVEEAIRETLWHELGHYFGLHEAEVRTRERQGTNRF
ncbi:MAG TPA: metallopeptidase family protein [Candidatus Paceibacterota bacterium]|nr:metallopeptidase family protein [Candidatus Paceibacterota bacterium]